MKDILDKFETARSARARAILSIDHKIERSLQQKDLPKGDPFAVAQVAAIQAAKRTADLIPYCHPIPLDHVAVTFTTKPRAIAVEVEAKAIAKTGVEMEALNACAVASLTLYDMLKPLGGKIVIQQIELVEKEGGKSSYAVPPPRQMKCALLIFSDSVYAGKKEDKAGAIAKDLLKKYGVKVGYYKVLPDEKEAIARTVRELCDGRKAKLLVTSGGTGASKRDTTPEAIIPLLDKRFEGIEEAIRAYGARRTPYASLSRCVAGVRGESLILALPGSSRGVRESLDFLLPWVFHIYRPMQMKRHD